MKRLNKKQIEQALQILNDVAEGMASPHSKERLLLCINYLRQESIEANNKLNAMRGIALSHAASLLKAMNPK